MRNQNPRLSILLLPLLATLSLASGCFGKSDDAIDPNSAQHGGGAGPAAASAEQLSEAEMLARLQLGVAGRDFGQINQSMASLTGINPNTGAPLTTYRAVTASLPGNNNLKTLAGPNVMALTRLAAQYCDSVTGTADANRAAMFPGINFGANASTITPAMRDAVITTLLNRFTKEAASADAEILQQLFVELRGVTPAVDTRGLMVALCTATLGSAKAVVVL